MTESDSFEMQQLASSARRRALDARGLARDRRRRAASALAGRQVAYAQDLLDSACWLEETADAEDRRATTLEAHRAALAPSRGRGSAARERR